ncbi:MAG: hypothetical protein SGI92_00465 [Bryobacteraceae bacterium]|nr:hypothetical protein [Bryobacteraceae bacterium]
MGFDLTGPKHPDKSTLLAWAEGELPWWRALLVRRHVQSCWHCRADVSALEAMFAAVSVNVGQMPEPSKVDVTRAWWRFQDAVRERYPDPARASAGALRLNGPRVIAASALLATVALAYVANSPLFRRDTETPVAATKNTVRREFTPPAPRLRPEPHTSLTPPAPPAVELTTQVIPMQTGPSSDDELIEAEVHAVEALHRSGLCRSSGIAVRRADGFVEVSGIARSRDQRIEIETLLTSTAKAGIVKVLIAVPEDVPLPPASPGNTAASASPADTSNVTPSIVGWLRESLHGRPGLTERDLFNLMNSMALASERASSEAWALRGLAEQFPQGRTVRLSPDLLATVLRMVEDHTIMLENDLTSLHGKLLVAPGTSTPVSAPARPAGESWQPAALTLQEDVEKMIRQFLASFSSDVADTHLRSMGERTEFCISMASSLRSDLQTRSAALKQEGRPSGR